MSIDFSSTWAILAAIGAVLALVAGVLNNIDDIKGFINTHLNKTKKRNITIFHLDDQVDAVSTIPRAIYHRLHHAGLALDYVGSRDVVHKIEHSFGTLIYNIYDNQADFFAAVERAAKEDIFILDNMIGDKWGPKGLSVAQTVREQGCENPIFIYTAFKGSIAEIAFQKLSNTRLVTKPANMMAFTKLILETAYPDRTI